MVSYFTQRYQNLINLQIFVREKVTVTACFIAMFYGNKSNSNFGSVSNGENSIAAYLDGLPLRG